MGKAVLNESERREVDLITYKGLQQLINECVDRCLRKWRSLNFPWQAPEALTKDGAYTIQEERDVRNAMQLCSESFDL